MSGDSPQPDVPPGDSTGGSSQARGGESDAEEVGATEAATPDSASGARHTPDATADEAQDLAAGDVPADATEPLKTCNLCQLEFPRSQFRTLSGGGTASYCTPCTSLVYKCEPHVTMHALIALLSTMHAIQAPHLRGMHAVQARSPILHKPCCTVKRLHPLQALPHA